MAKYLLIGNGFDLHHGLPTRYIDVLNVFWFLETENLDGITSVGNVISAYLAKHPNDAMMFNFYQDYKDHLETIQIDKNYLLETVQKLKSNCWFKYISQSCKSDITWVDFELIIQEVLNVFKKQFELDGDAKQELPVARGFSVKRKFFACFDNIFQDSSWATLNYRSEFLVKKYMRKNSSFKLQKL